MLETEYAIVSPKPLVVSNTNFENVSEIMYMSTATIWGIEKKILSNTVMLVTVSNPTTSTKTPVDITSSLE